MPPKSVSDQDVLDRLTDLFRDRGFDGATLGEIAAATGLQKSSLYHRFPDGKHEMAAEVARHLLDRFGTTVLAPLAGDSPARERVREVGVRLSEFYRDGTKNCLLEALSLGTPGGEAERLLRTATEAWIEGFADIARASGADSAEAITRAQDAVAAIEGGLVLARLTGDVSAFTRAIERLPDVLGTPQTRSNPTRTSRRR